MANTREALKKIGASNMNDEALVEAGKNTIREKIAQTLRDAGIEEAVGFEVKLLNGETISITSDRNPALDRPASDVAEVSVKQSARAGFRQVFVA